MALNLYRPIAMPFHMITSRFKLFAFIGIFVTSALCEAQSCRNVFSKSLGVSPQSVASIAYIGNGPRGRVYRQCVGSCRFEASLGYIAQFSDGVEPSWEYMHLILMYEQLNALLDATATEGTQELILNKHDRKSLWNLLANGGDDSTMYLTLKYLQDSNALVPDWSFRYSSKFRQKIREWREQYNLVYSSLDALEILDFKIVLILNEMNRMVRSGEESLSTAVRIARQQIDDIFSLAYSGLDPQFSDNRVLKSASERTNNIEQYLLRVENWPGQSMIDRFKVRLCRHDELEAYAQKLVVSGDKPIIHFYKVPEMLNKSKGIIRLNQPIASARESILADKPKFDEQRHAAIIESIALDEDGRMEWLLIRESQGTRLYDGGFLHMHIDYFRAFAYSVGGQLR